MRTTCLVPLLFVAACGHHTPASATPTSEQRSITVRMVQTDRPVRYRPGVWILATRPSRPVTTR